MEYVKAFDIPVISHAEDKNLSGKGVMNEGEVSTQLGLAGIPCASEDVMVSRDIQGAELDVFRGGAKTLNNIVAIVSEVEFIHHYLDQPLFGDVCAFLAEKELMFHKFLRTGGRALKPIVLGNDPNLPVQYIWSDAIFIKDVFKIPDLPFDKLLKLGLLAFLYGSPDVTYFCFKTYDGKKGTSLHRSFLEVGG